MEAVPHRSASPTALLAAAPSVRHFAVPQPLQPSAKPQEKTLPPLHLVAQPASFSRLLSSPIPRCRSCCCFPRIHRPPAPRYSTCSDHARFGHRIPNRSRKLPALVPRPLRPLQGSPNSTPKP